MKLTVGNENAVPSREAKLIIRFHDYDYVLEYLDTLLEKQWTHHHISWSWLTMMMAGARGNQFVGV